MVSILKDEALQTSLYTGHATRHAYNARRCETENLQTAECAALSNGGARKVFCCGFTQGSPCNRHPVEHSVISIAKLALPERITPMLRLLLVAQTPDALACRDTMPRAIARIAVHAHESN